MHRNAEIQTVLREIVEADVLSSSMDELYRAVHRQIAKILPAQIFLISLLDEITGEIVSPYRADEADFIPERRPIVKGMTEYFLRLGRAAHLAPDDMARLRENGEYTLEQVQQVHVLQYLGAPLVNSQGKAIGTVSLAVIEGSQSFQPEDVEVLSIIAGQVAMAIERRQARGSLRESEEKYRLIFEHSPMGLLFFDKQGVIVACNDNFVKIIGSSQEALVGLNMLELPDKKLAAAVQNALDGCPGSYEDIYCSKTAKKRTQVRCLFAPVDAGTGSIQGGVGIVEDVTERVLREQEINRDAKLAIRVQNALLSIPQKSDYLEIDTVYQPLFYDAWPGRYTGGQSRFAAEPISQDGRIAAGVVGR